MICHWCYISRTPGMDNLDLLALHCGVTHHFSANSIRITSLASFIQMSHIFNHLPLLPSGPLWVTSPYLACTRATEECSAVGQRCLEGEGGLQGGGARV